MNLSKSCMNYYCHIFKLIYIVEIYLCMCEMIICHKEKKKKFFDNYN